MLLLKFFTLLLPIGVFVFTSQQALAVWFGTEDWGDGPKTQYPSQVKEIGQRESELLNLATRVQLGAHFRYLELTQMVKQDKSPIDRYIHEVVDTILAQTHPNLQIPLRRFFYHEEGSEFPADFFKHSNGNYYFRVIPQAGGQFTVSFDPEVKKTQLIYKLYRLMAVLELSHWSQAIGFKFEGDYRNQFPVVDLLNKIASALLVQELLSKMGTHQILAEINSSDISSGFKDLLRRDFLTPNYLQNQYMNWIMMYDGVNADKLVEWVHKIFEIRNKKSAAITSPQGLKGPLYQRIEHDLVNRAQDVNPFLLAHQARKVGDTVSLKYLSHLTVVTGQTKCAVTFSPQLSQ